jgi:hypothetical protein
VARPHHRVGHDNKSGVKSDRRGGQGRGQGRREGLQPGGRERLRHAALANQPWRFSTGPRTPEGKARVALNGKLRQAGPFSVRELRKGLVGLRDLAESLRELRGLAASTR